MKRTIAPIIPVCLTLLVSIGSVAADPVSNTNSPPNKMTATLKNALVNLALKETRRVSDMPAKVQSGFGKDDANRLANPGEPYSSGCVVKPGVARNRLIFAGALPDESGLYLVVWESGGFAEMTHLRIYDMSAKAQPLVYEGYLPGGFVDSPQRLKEWAAKQKIEQ